MANKGLNLRSFQSFKEMTDRQHASDLLGRDYWPKITRDMVANAGFEIAAVVSVSIAISNTLQKDGEGETWLQANCTKRWYSMCSESFVDRIVRIAFEDEGDAFRFAWNYEGRHNE